MPLDIGERLKKLRKERNLTQKELALRVSGGIDYTYIGKIERGEQLPSLKILFQLSNALDVPVHRLLVENDKVVPFTLERIFKMARGDELAKALDLLCEEDVSLVIEMIYSVVRHRQKTEYDVPQGETLLAADEVIPYRKK